MDNRDIKTLVITDASENNLKHVDVRIPHNSLTVITGVSGSGKSTLAYGVIFKESQRRFLESFSSYARMYLGKLEQPKVKNISGLQAALAINQKTATSNPRSTVGTLSGIYDYLRLLYARLGELHCPECQTRITDLNAGQCPACGWQHPRVQASLFSFNSKHGACPVCHGLGVTEQIDQAKLIADENRTLREGALVPTTPTGYIVYSQVRVDELNKVCNAHGFSVDIPWKELTTEQQQVVMYGSEKIKILFGKHGLESRLKWKGITAKPREEAYYKGMIPIMEEILKRDRNDNILRFASSFTCHQCNGSRLREEANLLLINGKNITQLTRMSLTDLHQYLRELSQTIHNKEVFDNILSHVFKRLEHLSLLGLDYLTPDRESTTLSGGEAQRIRLASQVGSGLQGILYILDEPSIGLHPRDNQKLLKVLKSLRDNGNTVVVVEHDQETMEAADYLIDIGPKAGEHGGQVLFQGAPSELFLHPEKYPESITAQVFSTDNSHYLLHKPRKSTGSIHIRGASKNNLRHIDVELKQGAFNVVTGVSGAGKSTLVHHVLGNHFRGKSNSGAYVSIESSLPISRVIEIDQSPIGRTPRSNPATYTGLFDHIRDLFAGLPESKKQGFKKGRFSFNNVGGRCETCQGAGYLSLGMHFLGDVEVICDSCQGQRFNQPTLEITYHGKNIFEVLELSVEEARQFFEGQPKITRTLDALIMLDVGYLKLGQPSTTLSGGEAQRIKLASELQKTTKDHGLYILDEPSVGLHKADISYLLNALNHLVDQQNTVVVIEHDPDIIAQADHLIDLGPEGGKHGGQLVAQGSPSEIINLPESYTGKALKAFLNKKPLSQQVDFKALKKYNIRFSGVTTNNLKNINVEIPLNKTTVITGISGSGKSSLAFDTIFSESRNRFTESFSTYARRMMSKVRKPELEQCVGLTPAIALRQNRFGNNPRSTVGTATEIYDHYRLLFSRFGKKPDGTNADLPASMFSFNKMEAACPSCNGMGIEIVADPEKFITHPEKSILDGAMNGTTPGKFFGDPFGQYVNTLLKVGETLGMDFAIPYNQLPDKERNIALFGTGETLYDVEWNFKRGTRIGTHRMTTPWKGMANYLLEDYELKRDSTRAQAFKPILSEVVCSECGGHRLKKEALEITFGGLNISDLSALSITSALEFIAGQLELNETEHPKATDQLFRQLMEKYRSLTHLGLGYLAVNRPTSTLSGGEAQRLRLAGQLSSDMCGLTYVLDEPTVGLHPRDTQKLLSSIDRLRNNGNTIIMVEHDPEIIRHADHIIDMGPDAGEQGGEIIAEGGISQIMQNPRSVTGNYLKKQTLPAAQPERTLNKGITITGAHANNLKNLNIHLPSEGIIAVTGVSGSGKTSLAFKVVAHSYQAGRPVNCTSIDFGKFQSVSIIDQQRIGTSPLSTPATYTGIFDLIREVFAGLPEAKKAHLKKNHFSFNNAEGRCETCKGMGQTRMSLDFLSDVWVTCESCLGARYKKEVLYIRWKELNMNDVLHLEVSSAMKYFHEHAKISHKLKWLNELGLGYLRLGQATDTLSGGETQRLKLASELMKENKGRCLYIFDEPSTGLHMQDVDKLIDVFNQLVNEHHTILVVEHNQDIIKASDWVIDLGPEGGEMGGELCYEGKPVFGDSNS